MDGSSGESMEVDAFELRLAEINTVDLNRLHALSISVGWPHRAVDWAFLREVGQGIVTLDEIGRVLGSAMWFPQGDHFATIGMVITSPRLQALGTGLWLMKHALARCEGRGFRLNATRAARRIYLSLDFQRDATVFQCQGEARPSDVPSEAPPGAELRGLTDADLAALAAIDAQGFGAPRPALMAALSELSTGYGLFRNGVLEAFALCRRFGRGHVIGPVVAQNDRDAIAVTAPHVATHAGQFLRLDTHLERGEFATFLAKSRLSVFDTVLTMSLGAPFVNPNARAPGLPATYALASQALG